MLVAGCIDGVHHSCVDGPGMMLLEKMELFLPRAETHFCNLPFTAHFEHLTCDKDFFQGYGNT